ncbi:MAG TPA: Nif3-like dinuclear metal center hexameric protein [Candidatus Hydrogenedentes bacterium]|nr:Nif3-like dinuclear metal center hexameric protein [Candidatus Hydrogenedentota bacterium]HOK88413.1 Nif3-like dinuclear metal center hexameric protein [Candidatus Hydrogenedentota bacterium]
MTDPTGAKREHTVADVRAWLDQLAPPAWGVSWDRGGLQVGRPDATVTGICVCLNLRPEVIDFAREHGANLFIAHHPPVWDPVKALRTDHPGTLTLVRAAALDMHCLAAHTCLDVAPGGINDALADALGLTETRPLFPSEEARQVKIITFLPADHVAPVRRAMGEAGAGMIGIYRECAFSSPGTGSFFAPDEASPFTGSRGQLNEEPEVRLEMIAPRYLADAVVAAMRAAHPYEEPAYDVVPLENTRPDVGLGRAGLLPEPMTPARLLAHAREKLSAPAARLAMPRDAENRTLRVVGVLGGSGGSLVQRIPPGIDAYLTGEVSYHQALDAVTMGRIVIEAGHHETEFPGVRRLAEHLRGDFPDLPVVLFEEDPPHLPG